MKVSECEAKIIKILGGEADALYPNLADDIVSFINSEFGLDPD